MASAASSYSDLFGSWPEMAQRVQTQASGPSSSQVGETGYTGDVRSSAANAGMVVGRIANSRHILG